MVSFLIAVYGIYVFIKVLLEVKEVFFIKQEFEKGPVLLNLEDFRPFLKKYISETEYIVSDTKIKNSKLEDFYYLKSVWSIWYNSWRQQNKSYLIMEYNEN